MEDYKVLLQVIGIIICLFFLYLLIKYIKGLMIKNRLSLYSINLDDTSIEYKSVYKVINSFAKFLDSLGIFNGIARTYERYIYNDSKLRKGMDYISLKIIVGILMILLYLFLALLYRNDILLYLVIICFILGFLLPDFYCVFKENKRERLTNQDILKAVIIMSNSYKVKRNNDQAINDVINRSDGILKHEFQRVLSDIKIGLEINDAFLRLYYRTGLTSVLKIANYLKTIQVSGISSILVFEEIEKELVSEEKFNQELYVYYSVNKIAHLLFLLLPLFFIIFILVFNHRYTSILYKDIGVFLILILGIIYLLYMLFLRRIIGGKYDKE